MADSPKQTARRRHGPIVIALYVNAALLLALLVVLASRGGSSVQSMAWGQLRPPVEGGSGIYVMPAQFSSNTWGCYLLDTRHRTLSAYQYTPGDRQLHFIAARNFRYDQQLGDYNTTPSPQDIAELVRRENLPHPATRPARGP